MTSEPPAHPAAFTDAWYDDFYRQQCWCIRPLTAGLILLVRLYQVTLRAVMGGHCRFTPTCSDYAIHALKRYGPFKGVLKIVWRLGRCNPLGGSGWDPA